MAEFERRYATAARSRAGAGVETLDQGLRAFMLGVYNNMAMGLAVTGVVAYGDRQTTHRPTRRWRRRFMEAR